MIRERGWKPSTNKKRMGPKQVQVVLLVDKDLLDTFDRYIPAGKRSEALRALMAGFIEVQKKKKKGE